ncbi:MAG: hypothetical protein RR933_05620, partial [Oscillospiraceae bacterium]
MELLNACKNSQLTNTPKRVNPLFGVFVLLGISFAAKTAYAVRMPCPVTYSRADLPLSRNAAYDNKYKSH